MSIEVEHSHHNSENALEGVKLVEVAVTSDGQRVPMGLMSTEQALSLPEDIDVEVSHPEHEAGATDTYISRDELKEHVEEQRS
ncbi:hypothetical protein [Rhizobium sp. S163]|uniref:hypothetical protein n=1 Tax=Rhizobium sp. S163 TaxID=3055039 RepID=UPI0025AA27D2|nr:hypothetical protein [Rhizobium sp. S163]MDM9646825.1 hypothetical protein [Rhizobium sp. S163]